MKLSALLGETNLQNILILHGLTEFGGSPDEMTWIHLCWNLLMFPLDTPSLSNVERLVKNINISNPEGAVFLKGVTAFLHYRLNDPTAASEAVTAFFDSGAKLYGPVFLEELRATATFLKACIEAKSGKLADAKNSYDEALKLHTHDFEQPGRRYKGRFWPFAAEAEIVRREANSLLGLTNPSLAQ